MEDQENNNSSNQNSQQRILHYRELLNKVETLTEANDLGFQTVKDVGEILKDINALEEECPIDNRVENAEETLLDATVLASTSNILVKCIQAVDVYTTTYEPSDFTQKIISSVKTSDSSFETNDLLSLLEDVRQIVPEVPNYSLVVGYDLNIQRKPVKQRQKPVREELVVKQPKAVTELDNEEEGINEIVKNLYKLLLDAYQETGEDPINYYDYVIDTDDYGKTVENMFYCSFLVRDGRVHFDLDGRGTPFLKPMKSRDLKEFRNNNGMNAQIITSITLDDWERFKKPGIIQRHKSQK